MADEATSTKVKVNIIINGEHFKLNVDHATGRALKQLAGIPSENLLFRERHGPGDDEQVSDIAEVALHDGDRFYDMPPGNFG